MEVFRGFRPSALHELSALADQFWLVLVVELLVLIVFLRSRRRSQTDHLPSLFCVPKLARTVLGAAWGR